jgi:hypothetical protein
MAVPPSPARARAARARRRDRWLALAGMVIAIQAWRSFHPADPNMAERAVRYFLHKEALRLQTEDMRAAGRAGAEDEQKAAWKQRRRMLGATQVETLEVRTRLLIPPLVRPARWIARAELVRADGAQQTLYVALSMLGESEMRVVGESNALGWWVPL